MKSDEIHNEEFWTLVEKINLCMMTSYRNGEYITLPLVGTANRDRNVIQFVVPANSELEKL